MKKPYEKPRLVRREVLSKVTSGPIPSGVDVNGGGPLEPL
jgi:hypothetical protein